MNNQHNKLLIKIGNLFEASATGTISVLLLFAVVVILVVTGFFFN